MPFAEGVVDFGHVAQQAPVLVVRIGEVLGVVGAQLQPGRESIGGLGVVGEGLEGEGREQQAVVLLVQDQQIDLAVVGPVGEAPLVEEVVPFQGLGRRTRLTSHQSSLVNRHREGLK